MTKLYLVRHGETMDNAAQIMQGQTPEVARKMASDHIDVFVSSDLYRSMQTCAIIARPHLEAEMRLKGTGDASAFLTEDDILQRIETTPLIRERDWGDFTGKFIPSLPKDPKDWPDNVESLERMKSRAQNFLTWLKVAYPDKTILAVGHGIINKAIQSVYYKRPMNQIEKMANAEVRVLIL